MSVLKNVAITAASGALGSVILRKLLESGKFNVKVLKTAGSKSTFAAGIDVVEVDYKSTESLTAALQGQDAVISCVTSAEAGSQNPLIDAAVASGVKRFLPSEFGCDTRNAKTAKLAVFGHKLKTQAYLEDKIKGTETSYTLVCNNAFLDWGISHHLLLDTSEYKPMLIDGGDLSFSTTTLASVADAVVGVLSHPDETRNRAVYIRDRVLTQNQLFALAKEVAPNKPWQPFTAKLDDLTAVADANVAKGDYSWDALRPGLFRGIFDPEYAGPFGADNELLGVKANAVTDDDIRGFLKQTIN